MRFWGFSRSHTNSDRAEVISLTYFQRYVRSSSSSILIIYENISLQIGLDKKVRQQKQTPDWFVADRTADYSNKYAGTYLATWTFIASPSVD